MQVNPFYADENQEPLKRPIVGLESRARGQGVTKKPKHVLSPGARMTKIINTFHEGSFRSLKRAVHYAGIMLLEERFRFLVFDALLVSIHDVLLSFIDVLFF